MDRHNGVRRMELLVVTIGIGRHAGNGVVRQRRAATTGPAVGLTPQLTHAGHGRLLQNQHLAGALGAPTRHRSAVPETATSRPDSPSERPTILGPTGADRSHDLDALDTSARRRPANLDGGTRRTTGNPEGCSTWPGRRIRHVIELQHIGANQIRELGVPAGVNRRPR